MSVIRLQPAFKDYLWGGTKLKTDYGKKTDLDIVAESWELSAHPDGPSTVLDGEHAGKTFPQYLQAKGKTVLGTKGAAFLDFPIMIKFIDAAGSLSIQVHPDDAYALKNEKEYGKTEMWYIMDCTEGAQLYYGVNQSIDRAEFERRIQDNTIMEVLRGVPVHKGDVFFIPAGTIHAIGAGIQICEIQQTSNSTYRVYDFGRVGKDGKPRPLHIRKALDVSNLNPVSSRFEPCGPSFSKGDGTVTRIATCDKFTTYVVEDEGQMTWNVNDDSFGSITVLDGSLSILADRKLTSLHKGETAFIEAGTGKVSLQGCAQFIYARV